MQLIEVEHVMQFKGQAMQTEPYAIYPEMGHLFIHELFRRYSP
jgi:hypothetical protein